jgi:hypothetical protein
LAGRGPAPKDPSQVRRRNAQDPLTVIVSDGEVHGPELPDSFEWPAVTLEWWETWRRSAQASTFTDTDWSFLVDTAVMHAEFWLGERKHAAELRLRVAKFGATPEDRQRLKIEVGKPDAGPKRLQSKSATDRKARLLKAVGSEQA